MKQISFLLAEKSYLIRKGLVSVINRIESAVVIHEMESLEFLQSEIGKRKPDFVILNTNLIEKGKKQLNLGPDMDSSQRVLAIHSSPPRHKSMDSYFAAILDINDSKEEMMETIEGVINLSGIQTKSLIINNELSEREKTILTHVALGETNKEIADSLFLSTHTVITHRKNITSKLGIKTIAGLTVYAILNKLVKTEDVQK